MTFDSLRGNAGVSVKDLVSSFDSRRGGMYECAVEYLVRPVKMRVSSVLPLFSPHRNLHYAHIPLLVQVSKMVYFRSSSLALTFAFAAAMPQVPAGISDLPDCALNALPAVLSASGCTGIDVACLCSKVDLAPKFTTIVDDACPDETDRAKVQAFVAGFCPTSSTSAPASTSTDAPVAGAAVPASTTTVAPTWSATVYPSASGSWVNHTNGTNGTSTPTYNPPQPTGTGAPVSEGGAASNFEYSMFAFVVAMGGMTWAFAEL